MGFHFPIMPRIYMALKKGRADDMIEILRRTPPIPENCQWCIFLRNHDELTLEMVSPEDRQWMWEQYAPEPRMRINLGIRRRLTTLLDNDHRRVELANSLLFTLPGSPIIYYGDEIGMGDNLDLPDRNGVRTPMQWDDSPNAGFTSGVPFTELVNGDLGYHKVNVARQLDDRDSLFHRIRRMIDIRKQTPALGHGSMEWIQTENPALAAYQRTFDDQTILVLNNLSDAHQSVSLPADLQGNFIDLFSDEVRSTQGSLTMSPHGYLWLKQASG